MYLRDFMEEIALLGFTGLEGKFLYEFSLVASTVFSVWFTVSKVLWMMMKFAILPGDN